LLPQIARGPSVVMAKKGLHPDWHEDSKVICNGEEVLVTSGTKPSYNGERQGRRRALKRRDTPEMPRAGCGRPRRTPARPAPAARLTPPVSLAAAVDIWSGNHPFFQGVTTTVVTDEGRVNRFKRRFAGLESLAKIETAADAMARQKEENK
jgi:ribosomal protein L31